MSREHDQTNPHRCWCEPIIMPAPAAPLPPFHRFGEPMRAVFSRSYVQAIPRQRVVAFHLEYVRE